jgi:carboxymethylenebutenolidase
MTELQRYLAEEIAVDHADGIIDRREALRRLGLLGLGMTAASSLLSAFAADVAGASGGTGARPATGAEATVVPTEATPSSGPRGGRSWALGHRPKRRAEASS